MHRCPQCQGQVSWSREILRGIVVGICPYCGYRKGDQKPTFTPDHRGRPRHPGPWKETK